MKTLAIKVDNTSKSFRKIKAIDSLSFEVEKAQSFGLLGPNGAGKTTMMNIIYGKTRRDDPQPGQINVFGYDPLNNELEIKYLAGIVPQENNLDIELSVVQNLLIYSKFYGLGKRDVMPRIEYLLDFMELSDKKEAKIKELSGGMQRRLILVRALIHSPKLLILDEPTTGLDPQVRHLIWDKLHMLKQEGVTILITTHYMEEAFQLCDNLIIMHNGKKVLEGNPAALVQENMEPYVLEIFKRAATEKVNPPPDVRMEKTFSRMLVYSYNIKALENISAVFQPGDFYIRQSNLEDLFLKTTGRNLNEQSNRS
ncbi:ABC transporter ATP-binding protein [Thermodesulfobacteriota bacterium]